MEFIEQLYNGNIDINEVSAYISNLSTKLLPFIIIYYIIWTISMWFLLKKEDKRPWYSLIPFYNMYLYFKICDLPFILFFIPIINIITLLIMPYNLAKEYNCNDLIKIIAIFIPYIIIPYIAFSKLQNRNKKIKFDYLKFGEDIDHLEDKLKVITDDNYIIDDKDIIPVNNKTKNVKSKANQFVDSLEFDISDDEYVEDEEHIEYKNVSHLDDIKAKPEEELVDLEDDNNQLDIYEIDNLDEDIKLSSQTEVKIEQDIKDYEKEGPSVKAIAFGGKKEIENNTEAKNDDLKCPYCNSSLAGSKGICPGCSRDVSDIIFENVKLTQIKM